MRKAVTKPHWIRSAVTDATGNVDVAYVSLFGVMVAVLGAIVGVVLLAYVAHLRCSPFIHEAIVLCAFDPQPLGIAVGAICTGFATAIGGLAAYMAATRPQRK